MQQQSETMKSLKRFLSRKITCFSLIVCLSFLFVAFFAEGYSIYCNAKGIEPAYERESFSERNMAPCKKYWLGTDYLGRSVALRSVFGAKTAVKVGVIASLISVLFGVTLGLLAGYFGGKTDDIVVWIYSTFASMPSLLFILAFSLLVSKGFLFPPLKSSFDFLAKMLGTEPGMLSVYLGIGLTGWVSLCRVVRAEVMKLREMQYVQAAKVIGISHFRILVKHILPNVSHLIIIYFTMRFAEAIMTEVIVSYLGFGAVKDPSWGLMISQGQSQLWRGIWWEAGSATFFMFLLVLSLNLLGDALRDATDPKLKI